MRLKLSKEIETLTKKLISINSSNNNEKNVADYIEKHLKANDYFKKHPNHIININKPKNRNTILAYIKGKTPNTIILMGHIDTVSINDYGKSINEATKPDKIIASLKKNFNLPKEVLKDMASNNYMFSRGALDMKAGVASNICIFEYFANHLNELNGNLVLLCEADEEKDSEGIISALNVLNKLKQKEKFDYKLCINADYSTSHNNERYVYLGTVGKMLPCFVAIGKEAHVGSPFSGFDPNLLLSILNKNISLNSEFVDSEGLETSVPPICLKQTNKNVPYSVQTVSNAMSYYNFMLYKSSPKNVLTNCIKIAKTSFSETIELMNKRYKDYCKNNSLKYNKLSYRTKVYTYDEWFKLLSKNKQFIPQITKYKKQLLKQNPSIDIRDLSYELITKSYEYYKEKDPVLIIFFGSNFYAGIKNSNKKLISSLKKSINEINKESKYNIKLKNYYPYISDMSFLNCPFNSNEIKEMIDNCPFAINYPYELIKKINVPVVNIGTFGKDGHTYLERLQKDYCFNEMPNLTYNTIVSYLK